MGLPTLSARGTPFFCLSFYNPYDCPLQASFSVVSGIGRETRERNNSCCKRLAAIVEIKSDSWLHDVPGRFYFLLSLSLVLLSHGLCSLVVRMV